MADHLSHPWIEELGNHVYVWRVPAEPTTEELASALKAIRHWIVQLDEPYGWVNDPRALRLATIALERKMVADHLRVVEPYSVRFCKGMCTIVSNPLIRGIGTAIGWLYAYPFPVAYEPSEKAALSWVYAQMDA